MKKSMPAYVAALSEESFSVLEEIFEDKYQKFIEFYWLIREYSDFITKIKYKKTKKEILKISVKLDGIDIDRVYDDIRDQITEKDNVKISKGDELIHLEIHKDEMMTLK